MTTHIPSNLKDLQHWLTEREDAIGSIRVGAEKSIDWNDATNPQQTDFSVVYLHGYSATRQELFPLPEQLAAALNANLHCTRLPSHGLLENALHSLTLQGLKETGIEAVNIAAKLGKRRVIIAASTGATLATWLAANGHLNDDDILLFLSPNFGAHSLAGELLIYPALRIFIHWKKEHSYGADPRNQRHGKYWTTHYPVKALFPMLDLVRETRKLCFEEIKNPLLILFSGNDKVVSIKKLMHYYKRFGSSQKTLTEIKETQDSSSHTLAGDILSPMTTEAVLAHCLNFTNAQKA